MDGAHGSKIDVYTAKKILRSRFVISCSSKEQKC